MFYVPSCHIFFFSSRRRHTRWPRDWSSDVCSSDLAELEASVPPEARGIARDAVRMMVAHKGDGVLVDTTFSDLPRFLDAGDLVVVNTSRSEERRVGKEGRCAWAAAE